MRILQVVHEFPPDAWAGTELVTLSLARELQARGHDVTVLTRVADPDAAEFSFHEQRRYGLAVVAVVNNYTRITSPRLAYDNDFFEHPFAELLARFQPDVVHFQHLAHLSVNLLATAARLGYPTVLSLHDFYFACHLIHLIDTQNKLCPGPERGARCVHCLQGHDPSGEIHARFPFMETALQTPDVVLAPSQFLVRKMLDYFPVLASRLRVVPLGVDPPVLPTGGNRSPGAPLRILCVGVLIPHKGAHVLLEALQGLPHGAFEASFYGTTPSYWQPYIDGLHRMAEGLPVQFRGVYAHEELGAILARHDVVVMPGICEETFSLMTREALLAGLPVIAARRGALPEIVRDGENGFLFEPENPETLRRCLSRFLEEPELLERLRDPSLRVKTSAEYAVDMEAIYAEIRAEPFRSAVLQQRLADQYQVVAALRRQNEQQQAELQAAHARYEALESRTASVAAENATLRQACERTDADVQALTAQLRAVETRARDHEERLNAIYESTTWKCYRGYEMLKQYLFHRPTRRLRRWLMRQERS